VIEPSGDMSMTPADKTADRPRRQLWRWILGACLATIAAAIIVPNLRTVVTVLESGDTQQVVDLLAYHGAQEAFLESGSYGPEKSVYANPIDGSGYRDLYRIGYPDAAGGRLTELIDRSIADAHGGRAEPRPKAGFLFLDITGNSEGPYDYAHQFGLCAYPHSYERTGRHTYIIDSSGAIYWKDIGGRPVTVWPDVRASCLCSRRVVGRCVS